MQRPPRSRRETPVVPLHAHRPQHALRTDGGLAIAEASALPTRAEAPPRQRPAASPAGARARRATNERQAHDGWTFVVVPPGVGARPRTLHISVRRFRVAAASLVTLAGTAVVCGGLLTVLLSMAPAIQDESAGVQLGVFDGDDATAPQTPVPAPVDLLSLLAIGPAAATVMNPTAPPTPANKSASPAGTATAIAGNASSPARRRVIAAPSVSGRRPAVHAAASAATAEGLPVIGRITSRFSTSRRHPLLGVVRPHHGVDIAAATGTPITAPAAGRVVFAGRKFGFGNVVELDHGNGVVTRYAHCQRIHVRAGDQIADGTAIATVGRTGLASGPHLHFEVLVEGRSVDPLKQQVAALVASRSQVRREATAPPMHNIFAPGLPVIPVSSADSMRSMEKGDAAQAGDERTPDLTRGGEGTEAGAARYRR